MNIIVTGISKCDKLGYLKEVQKFSKEFKEEGKGTGKEVKIYSVGKYLAKELAPHTTVNEHTLNKDDDVLGLAAGSALKTIKIDLLEDIIKGAPDRHNIISTHTTFIWKNHWKQSYNEAFLKMLSPDLFITVLEHEPRIQRRQHNDSQWELQELDIGRIALWQDLEVIRTEEWAKKFGKRHLVFGRNEHPETLYKMMNYPKAPVFYSNFPMTYLQNIEESYSKVDLHNRMMNLFGPVIDPRTIEIMKKGEKDYYENPLEKEILQQIDKKLFQKQELSETEELMVKYFLQEREKNINIVKCLCTKRDLDYYVAKADVDVLYFPELVLSFGGVAEVLKAYRCSKPTYIIFSEDQVKRAPGAFDQINNYFHDLLPKKIGPFERYHSLKMFFGLKEFHNFLDKTYKKLPMYE